MTLWISRPATPQQVAEANDNVDRFLGEHADGDAVIDKTPDGQLYRVCGPTAEARSLAERHHLVERVRFWNARLAAVGDLSRRLVPVPGSALPGDFPAAVRMLRRPYIPITSEEHDAIARLATEHKADVLLLDGTTQVTFGSADCGYALMPLLEPVPVDAPERDGLGAGMRAANRAGGSQ